LAPRRATQCVDSLRHPKELVQPARPALPLLDPRVASELGIVAAKESAIYEWQQEEK